ncbi:MAG TPA: GNAT family N-acetyltransferase [Streptosporangiaceae bacterium]|jgi:GNAT superfamily N-acetyltransferase|nr:GNAT family N-acetyltransferase [Streptosporangiaceae bacterium]
MSRSRVRGFRRSDREQLTELVNAHAAAVVPGLSASVSSALAQLERQPGEFIVDPWVSERRTLIAEQNQRVAAAAHLIRYADDDRVGASYRNLGEIRWLLFWPEAALSGPPHWTDGTSAAEMLMTGCVRRACTESLLSGRISAPCMNEPDSAMTATSSWSTWPGSRTWDGLRPPLAGLQVRRSVGINGTRFSAALDVDVIGYIEVEIFDDGERRARHQGWADIGNLWVASARRRRGIATWLLGEAAAWLQLGMWTGCWPTPTWKAVTRPARAMTRTGPSSGRRRSLG